MTEKTKEQRISAEKKRLLKLFAEIDGEHKALCSELVNNAAFMAVTLQDLQMIINESGATEEYKHGANQYGMKPAAALQAYNALVKNFNAVMKNLNSYLPKQLQSDADDFDAFIAERAAM